VLTAGPLASLRSGPAGLEVGGPAFRLEAKQNIVSNKSCGKAIEDSIKLFM
jgi:hypothetical protein